VEIRGICGQKKFVFIRAIRGQKKQSVHSGTGASHRSPNGMKKHKGADFYWFVNNVIL
jgi:hypothetical protein